MAKKSTTTNHIPGGKLNNYLNNISEKFLDYKQSFSASRKSKKIYFMLLVTGILLLALYKKSLFIAAVVNGAPITNLELQMKLNDQFRTQILNQMINEKIIINEAAKNNALPTQQEVNKRISELEASVGGKDALNSLLSQQGQTISSLREQVMVQLAITKLYEKNATVSAEEISKFIVGNKAQLQATDSASQEKEAENNLKQQKLSQIFSQKFQELKQKANIKVF